MSDALRLCGTALPGFWEAASLELLCRLRPVLNWALAHRNYRQSPFDLRIACSLRSVASIAESKLLPVASGPEPLDLSAAPDHLFDPLREWLYGLPGLDPLVPYAAQDAGQATRLHAQIAFEAIRHVAPGISGAVT